MSARDVSGLLEQVSADALPRLDDLESLLGLTDPLETQALFDAADAVRRRHMGDGILLRGIVEFGSWCRNTCSYCGLHAGNSLITRYRMSAEEIIESVSAIAAQDIRTVVLQSGEDEGLDPAWLAEVVREIKGQMDIAVTLSVGNLPGVKGGYLAQVATFPSDMAQNFWLAAFAFIACFALTLVISLATKSQKTIDSNGTETDHGDQQLQ